MTDDRPDPSLDRRTILDASIGRRTFLKVAAGSAVAAGLVTGAGSVRPATVRAQGVRGTTSAEIEAVAAGLDYDQERIFRFVADDILYEPYTGVLRGPIGTLRGRAGNAADKALLLAALLDAAAIPVRFQLGTLDAAMAGVIASAARTLDAATARGVAAEVMFARPAGMPAAPVPVIGEPVLAVFASSTSEVVARAGRQLDDGVRTIVDALAGAGIALPVPEATLPEMERTAHAWAQVHVGTDWLDLDPTLPGALQGDSLTAPTADGLDALPDMLRHRVELAVIAESVVGGALEQAEIQRMGAWADELIDAPILAFNARPSDIKGLGVSIDDAIGGTATYHPIIAMGDRSEAGGRRMALGAQGATDPFGNSGTGEGETTAQWLELSVTSPGAAPVVVRRLVFDRVGMELRAAGGFDAAALTPVELTDVGASGLEYLPALKVHALSVTGGPVGGGIFEPVASTVGSPAGSVDLAVLPRIAHYVRDGANAELGLIRGVRVVGDGPTVVAWTLEPGAMGADGPVVRSAVDLWHRRIGTLPLLGSTATGTDPVMAGVLSHVAERIVTGDVPRGPDGSVVPALSVGAVFEQAAAEGIATRVLRGPDMPLGLPFGAEARALIGAALAQGQVVIVPERPVLLGGVERVGWWLVDPLTGRTSDQLDDGRGVSMPGYAQLRAMAIRWGPAFVKLGACIAKVGGEANQYLGYYGNEIGGGIGDALNVASYVAQAAADSGAGALC